MNSISITKGQQYFKGGASQYSVARGADPLGFDDIEKIFRTRDEELRLKKQKALIQKYAPKQLDRDVCTLSSRAKGRSRAKSKEEIKRERKTSIQALSLAAFIIVSAGFAKFFPQPQAQKDQNVVPSISQSVYSESSKADKHPDVIIDLDKNSESSLYDFYNEQASVLNPIFDFDINLNSSQEYSLNKFLTNWENNNDRYKLVEELTGVPAELIAAIHFRESSGNFSCRLRDGKALGGFSSWEESAVDALLNYGAKPSIIDKEDISTYFEYAERYNGTGYRDYYDMKSPYIWAGTENYVCGKYDYDGHFNPDLVDSQLGVAVMLEALLNA